MNDYFIFDGVDSRSFDAYVFDRDTSSAPERQFTTVTIPGRSGDFLLDGSRFGNMNHEYDVIIYKHFDDNFEALRSFLLSRPGYCKLSDTIHPAEHYHAYYSDAISPTIRHERDMGKFSLRFSRKPQRWLESGDQEIPLRTGGTTKITTLLNPTRFACYPLLKVSGSNLRNGFKLDINGTAIELTAYNSSTNNYPNSSYLNSYPLYIDLYTLQAYVRYDSSVYYYNTAVKYTLPTDARNAFKLSPGNNTITYTTVTNAPEIAITPRWYTL